MRSFDFQGIFMQGSWYLFGHTPRRTVRSGMYIHNARRARLHHHIGLNRPKTARIPGSSIGEQRDGTKKWHVSDEPRIAGLVKA